MVDVRHTIIVALCLAATCAVQTLAPGGVRAGEGKLKDTSIVWYEDDRRHIPKPVERDPNVRWDGFNESVVLGRERTTDPVRLIRKVGGLFGRDHVPPAANINALDETPNSTWFTNRIGMFPMTPEEAARGPGTGTGPDRRDVWTVIAGKLAGVTKGFTIRDAKGDTYLIKFDPPGYLGMTVGAGVIANRILHAAGYNVPEDVAVTFTREDLVLGEAARVRGTKRHMTESDLAAILDAVDRLPGGEYLALSSKFLPGKPIGPFNYKGSRRDDANDTVRHEHRRELRGLYVFASWLNHFDTKQHNSLDTYVTENGHGFVKHYLIDMASTLGGGGQGPPRRSGYEYTVDPAAVFGRLFTMGLREDPWRRRTRPEDLSEVGYFVSDVYHPDDFKPHYPNWAFANATHRDKYWAAKIVAAFSDDHIRAIVREAQYPHVEAASYIARILMERRDKIVQHYFDKVAPLDMFTSDGDLVRFVDLGERYTVYGETTPRYRLRCAVVDEDRKARSRTSWVELTGTSISMARGPALEAMNSAPAGEYPFLAMEVQVNRGQGWSRSVTAYRARKSGRLVAVDH